MAATLSKSSAPASSWVGQCSAGHTSPASSGKASCLEGCVKCDHGGCQEHGSEASKGCVALPGSFQLIFGPSNPLIVSSLSGGSPLLSYAIGRLKFPDSPMRPKDMVEHFYPGLVACPILDSETAIFELHKEGPFLRHRRALLRDMIISSQSFAKGHYKKALSEAYGSLNSLLRNEIDKPSDRRLWGCGAFSLVVLIMKNTLYTAGAGGICLVLRPNETIMLPKEWQRFWFNMSNLMDFGQLDQPSGKRYFREAVAVKGKIEIRSGDYILVLPYNLYKLGSAEVLFRAAGLGLREICLDILDRSGLVSIPVTAPLMVSRIC